MARPLSSKNLISLLKPLARFFIVRSMSYQDFVSLAKRAFVEAAEDIIKEDGQKHNLSRLSVLSGVHRGDIRKIKSDPDNRQADESQGIIYRVLSRWENAIEYTTKAKKPRVLGCAGENNEFRELVASVAKSYESGTVLAEMVRRGLVERSKDSVRLLEAVEDHVGDADRIFSLISSGLETLVNGAAENALTGIEPRNLHLLTEYDNIAEDAVPEIKEWLNREGMHLHKRARDFLSQFDLDINPLPKAKGGVRVSLGASSFVKLPKEK